MHEESKQDDGTLDLYTEHLVVQQVLDHTRGYPRVQLDADLDDIDPEWVENAIRSLEQAGVVVVKRTRIHPSRALQRLDDLHVICI